MLKNAIAIGPIVRKEFVKDYTSLSKDTIFKKLNLNPKLTNILVIGGSQGAKHINDTILLIAKKRIIPNINIIWITGNKFYQEYKNEIKKLPNNIIPIPYYEKMWELYKIANIVISRAGASTISEILFLQKKAILIPYPYSSDNHQYHNAIEALKKIQGTIIQDQKLSPEILINAIQQLLQNEKKTIGFPQDGTKLIINYISNTIKGI
jgi:UDP-N-acetylglucosamine--N-acetylmuramyl-(pentapeptide) pyrophosphoryl-undecaprenol N-acetylglucosamine transferase